MRHLISWQLSVLLLAGMAAGAQVPNSNQNDQSPGSPPAENSTPPDPSQVPTTQPTITPGLTVTSRAPHAEPPLPKLAPDKFTDCYGTYLTSPAIGAPDYRAAATCEFELARDERIVIDKCTNRDGKSAPPMAIQACTELLDRKILEGHERFYLFVNRANAYFAQGDKQHALDDYNTAVKLAPKNAKPYYYRGVFYVNAA
jgi:tetratricopeptide (TPR) repeat protein